MKKMKINPKLMTMHEIDILGPKGYWKESEREVTLGRQEEIKPLGQPGKYRV